MCNSLVWEKKTSESNMYKIFICSRCGRLLVADAYKKSRMCTYCGSRNDLMKVKAVGTAKTAKEASELVQHLKHKRSSG